MSDKDVIDRLRSVFRGIGVVYELAWYKQKNPNYKMQYRWSASSQTDALVVLYAIHGFLGQRRKAKAEEVIRAILARPSFARKYQTRNRTRIMQLGGRTPTPSHQARPDEDYSGVSNDQEAT
jgi:hypothetical protein